MKQLFFLVFVAGTLLADWKAGAAAVEITPAGPIWMGGYAARSHPSEGVLTPLFVKALAIEDERGERVVLVTCDIIGWPKVVSERIAVAALKQYNIERRQLLLNASHTHSGPVVWPNLGAMYPMNAEQRKVVEQFTEDLIQKTLTAVGTALGKLAVAELNHSQGQAKFATYRRLPQADGSIKLAPNPAGPVDHSVPVLQVRNAKQELVALLFSYSCHNTTMTGEFYQLNGDYAGFAQARLEKQHPSAVAMFATACAGDQNPNPRSAQKYAEAHGEALAVAVQEALQSPGTKLSGKLRSGYNTAELSFQPFGTNDFEKELESKNPYEVSRATAMLALHEQRRLPRRLTYPVQVMKLGSLGIVGLGGEVSVQYCLRLKKELSGGPVLVFGYSNDVMSYIPDARQVREGGYEGKDSFVYYQQPAPLAEKAEEEVVTAVKRLWNRVK